MKRPYECSKCGNVTEIDTPNNNPTKYKCRECGTYGRHTIQTLTR